MRIEKTEDGVLLTQTECFDAQLSCMCGQAFRWSLLPDGTLHGVVGSSVANIEKRDGGYLFRGTDMETFEQVWRPYFDLDRDYAGICRRISADGHMKRAVEMYYGIRILRQEPWEALCSFIISQNNNIPRISGIIKRLCESFGERLPGGDYSFPGYSVLAGLSPQALSPLRAGFRARYITDAASKLESRELSLEEIALLPLPEARAQLMRITGVGAKVAECTLLYGFSRMDAFPVDVWVKRIMQELYPGGLPECARGFEGIAQQYLFHWRREGERSD